MTHSIIHCKHGKHRWGMYKGLGNHLLECESCLTLCFVKQGKDNIVMPDKDAPREEWDAFYADIKSSVEID